MNIDYPEISDFSCFLCAHSCMCVCICVFMCVHVHRNVCIEDMVNFRRHTSTLVAAAGFSELNPDLADPGLSSSAACPQASATERLPVPGLKL